MNTDAEGRANDGTEAADATRHARGETPAVLSARGLKRAFGKVRAVDGLDLTVHAGEIYGFLGVNGAGKTTAIRLLMGIIKPDEGSLELLGEKTRRTTIRQKQSIGYVSQEQTFYPWMTCRALGRFVGGFYPSWDGSEFERLVHVLDLPPDRKVSQLSGGMRVKLALALALAPRPALLILDEPTSGLDPLARREFLAIIQQEAREHRRTTFFSSHIIGEIERVADRVGIIHRGRMYYEGSLEELRASIRLVQWPASMPIASTPSEPAPLPSVPKIPESGPECQVAAIGTSEAREEPTQAVDDGEIPPIIPSEPMESAPGPAPWVVPAGFQVLRDEARDGMRAFVLRAAPAAWETFHYPGAQIRELTVEDIFVALVGKGAIVA